MENMMGKEHTITVNGTTMGNPYKIIVTLDTDEYNTVRRWMAENEQDDPDDVVLPHGIYKITLEEDTSRMLVYMFMDVDRTEALAWVTELIDVDNATAQNRVLH